MLTSPLGVKCQRVWGIGGRIRSVGIQRMLFEAYLLRV
jgi:hypothetical protein